MEPAPRSTIENHDVEDVRRPATEADAIDGVMPACVIEPESAEGLAAVLADAARGRRPVVLRGSGTRLGWGRIPSHIDAIVSMRRLNRLVDHQHGDLTATVEAGATVREVNDALRRHGQWLPIEAANADATIGGSIATNDAGPLRQRHGTPRDLLIGIHLALTDGRLVKAGGNVVKNVAGYDLGKLISGSFGGLAAITSATFKLAPLPTASATAVATFRDAAALSAGVAAVGASHIEPTAFDVHAQISAQPGTGDGRFASRQRLLVQFASTRPAVDAQLDAARGLLAAESFDVVSGEDERQLWRELVGTFWAAPGMILRVSWLPANLGEVLRLVREAAPSGARGAELVGRAGVGAGFLRLDLDSADAIAAVEQLRARPEVVGHVVVLRAEREVKQRLDVWGPFGDREKLLRALKQAFDPAGILNAGRGPIS